ncbi:hypothetical protein ABFS83_11G084000 [Erythranthe nasuta]
MVNTRSSNSQNDQSPTVPNPPTHQISDSTALQLSAIAAKHNMLDSLAAEVAALKELAALKEQSSRSPIGETRTRGDDDDADNLGLLRTPSRRPHTKMDFPKYDGGDPLDVAAMYLEGDALDFFDWVNRERILLYWDDLYLCNIQQVGSVTEYRQEFAKRSSRVTNWPDPCLLGVFLNGLRDELNGDVRIHKPRTVYKAMSLALEFESKLTSNVDLNRLHNDPHFPAPNKTYPQPHSVKPPSMPSKQALSWEERQLRMTKGLCFRCNEKFGPGHRCKSSNFSLMELMENELPAIKEQDAINAHAEDATVAGLAEISFHAMMGTSATSTMQILGKIKHRQVLILVDIQDVALPIQEVPSFGVNIGNGDVIKCNQICRDISVLGIKWLASLNIVQANWNEMFLIFQLNGKKYKLQGVPHTPTFEAGRNGS